MSEDGGDIHGDEGGRVDGEVGETKEHRELADVARVDELVTPEGEDAGAGAASPHHDGGETDDAEDPVGRKRD